MSQKKAVAVPAAESNDSTGEDGGPAGLLRVVPDPWTIEIVQNRGNDADAIYIASAFDLEGLDDSLLLRIHNAATGTEMRRFPSRSTAAQKTWSAVHELFHSSVAQKRLSQQPTAAIESVIREEAAGGNATETLRAEIATLRQLVQTKSAELRSLMGRDANRGETATVTRALQLLRRPAGATKEVLIQDTGAKKGYVDALLNRILPTKGYVIRAEALEGTRTKAYFVDD